jgi:hypothetical protein
MSVTRIGPIALLLALASGVPQAQHYQRDFPPEELQSRWQKLYERIRDAAVAVVQGAPLTDGFIFPRQYDTLRDIPGEWTSVWAFWHGERAAARTSWMSIAAAVVAHALNAVSRSRRR